MLDIRNMIKIGEKPGGTVPGAMFKCNNAHTWLVKMPAHSILAQNEVLAAKLYRKAGVRVPEIELIRIAKDRYGVASRWEPNLERCHLDNKLVGLMEGFAVDAWLANWDVIGLEYDNVMADGDQAVRVDLGGSLLFRAQGQPKGKLFGPVVIELMTLMDRTVNPQAAEVFRAQTEADMIAGLKHLNAVTKADIENAVRDVDLPQKVADVLVMRLDFILKGFKLPTATQH